MTRDRPKHPALKALDAILMVVGSGLVTFLTVGFCLANIAHVPEDTAVLAGAIVGAVAAALIAALEWSIR